MAIERTIIDNAPHAEPEAPLESLRAARTLRKMRRTHGVDRVALIVEDAEGNWPEQWGEDIEENQEQAPVTQQYSSVLG